MADDCLPQIQACAIRVARLDPGSGVPLPGAGNLIVSNALTEMTYETTYEDGTDIFERNACGDACLDYRGPDVKRRLQISLTLCTHDPSLMAFLSGGDTLAATADNGLGWAAPPVGAIERLPISIEVWAKRIKDGDLDVDFPYAWWAFPKIMNLREGQNKFANEAKKPMFTGQGYENVNWYDGPANDWPATSDRTHQFVPWATIPTPACGAQALAAS